MPLYSPLSPEITFICQEESRVRVPRVMRSPAVRGRAFALKWNDPHFLFLTLTSYFALPYRNRASLLDFKKKEVK